MQCSWKFTNNAISGQTNLWSVHTMLSWSALSFNAGSVTESTGCAAVSSDANIVLVPLSGGSLLLVTLGELSTCSSRPGSVTVSKLSTLLVSGNASSFVDLDSNRSAEWSSDVELMQVTSSAITVAMVSDAPQFPSPKHYTQYQKHFILHTHTYIHTYFIKLDGINRNIRTV